MKLSLLLCFIWGFNPCIFNSLNGQESTQVIRGIVKDNNSKTVLIGAHISVIDLSENHITTSDVNGEFRLENIPTGRIRIKASYLGYEDYYSPSFIINSAKSPYLEIEMAESSVQMGEVVIFGKVQDDRVLNDMVTLSGRSFSAEETERYAGSIADPSRMTVGFAGVQSSSNDLDNDIVIRGNSSVGILWRVEGIDIPNPNHFARRGSSGGGISIFSVNMLRNSDFIYGGPPAEYGNVLTGVFDMKFRKGNNENHEHSFRIGLLGMDLISEGPLRKQKGSYLVNYRYSTLGLLNQMGIRVIDKNTDNTFTDLAFHLYLPSEDNKNILQVWGVGGYSSEIHHPVDDLSEVKEYEDLVHTDFKTAMGVMGLNYTRILKNESYLKFKLGIMGDHILHNKDTVDVSFTKGYLSDESYTKTRIVTGVEYVNKPGSNIVLKSGITSTLEGFNLEYGEYDRAIKAQFKYLDADFNLGSQQQFQIFSQARWELSNRLSLYGGFHFMILSLNESTSIDPRLALTYRLSTNSELSAAYGIYTQRVPLGNYYTDDSNLMLPSMESNQYVLSFTRTWADRFKFSAEAYYNSLDNIPVARDSSIHYWMLNDLVGYSKYELDGIGKGRNYGLDLSIEQFFYKGIFFLASMSLYKSEYNLDGNEYYSSRYDGRFNTSFMLGKEFNLDKKIIQLSFRNLFYGGQWYKDPDVAITTVIQEYYEDVSIPLGRQSKNYWRSDFRFSFRKNNDKNSWLLSLDIQNMFNVNNTRNEIWNIATQEFEFKKQAGIIPVVSFQIDY